MVALNIRPGAGLEDEIYAACAERANSEPRRGYLGMSQIGRACSRRLWLDLYAGLPREVDGNLARIFDMGHAVEARVIADLRLRYTVDGQQLEFTDFGGVFRGHCDGVIHGVTKRPHILEIKSANDASFRHFENRGIGARPEYSGQVQCYMGYSGLERALFVVENKNNQKLYFERVHFEPDTFGNLRAKAWAIIGSDTPPQRDMSDCRWCDFGGEGGLCGLAELSGTACGACDWFLSRTRLRANGADAGCDICSLLETPARRLGRCEEFTPRG